MNKLSLVLSVAGVLSIANAHDPYMLPNNFNPPAESYLNLDLALTEDFFLADRAFGNVPVIIRTPDGKQIKASNVRSFEMKTVAEQKLPKEEGTYNIFAKRENQIWRAYELNGKKTWENNPTKAVPNGAKIVNHYDSIVTSETYVSIGNPTNEVLKAKNQGLEILPLNNPNELKEGDKFNFKILFNGQPLIGYKVEFSKPEADYSGHETTQVTTDIEGKAEFISKNSGVYLAKVVHQTKASKGSKAPEDKFTHTMTFRFLEAHNHSHDDHDHDHDH